MANIDLLCAAWNLLGGVDTLFKCCKLPTIHAANQGEYGKLDGPELQEVMNDITTLRSDMILNPIKRNRVQSLNQLTSQSAVDDLAKVTEDLLDIFEGLVAVEALPKGEVSLAEKGLFNLEILTGVEAGRRASERFPKLRSLQAELQECSKETSAGDGTDAPTLDIGSDLESSMRLSKTQLARTLDRIQFPTDPKSIRLCRKTAEEFGQVFDRVFSKNNGKWKSQNQIRNFSDADIATIESAHGFSASCSSLFAHMTKDTVCGKTHKAKVHLSGFEKQQLNIMLETCCGTQWVHTCFTRSLHGMTSSPFVLSQICTSTPAPVSQSQMMYIGFNDSTMWQMLMTNEPHIAHNLRNMKILDRQRLKSQSRKLLEVLLACSLFQLYGSPWIQTQRWEWEKIHLHQYPHDRDLLHHVQPHMLCTLTKEAEAADDIDSEAVAAFGILLMELESNEEANWEDIEDDLEFGAPSHQLRLGIALEKWVGHVCDGYRAIAQACHDFPSLVNMVEFDEFGLQLKCRAVIYKCILHPLFNLLVTDHSATTALFKGIPGPWASLSTAISITPSKAAKQALFDDVDVEGSSDEVTYAKRFRADMDSFKESIGGFLTSSDRAKIRIAVLDSGVDKSDPMIGPAIRNGKIAKLKSWVEISSQDTADEQEDQADWHDTYGHGTHITKLLMDAAPAAEVYVAKICHKKTINDQFMSGIAKAIDWAVEEWNVHIISMSFGFKEPNDEIDQAINNAVQKNKLVFAAASNSGGLSDRPSRPALRSDVMCIYASDGLGNRGTMNPPLDRSNGPFHFSTLGVAVPCRWHRKPIWKSGTSFATPIAAGFAASVLEFVESVDYNWTVSKMRRRVLYEKRGMEAVFDAMSVPVTGDMRFVHPVHLWTNERSDEEVAMQIEAVIKNL